MTAPAVPLRPLEVTDLIWSADPVTGDRLPVRVDHAVAQLEARGQSRAVRLVRGLPRDGSFLDGDAVDALLLRAHCELQRLGEELQLPRRVAHAVRAWLGPLLAQDRSEPVRLVDVGCGVGHVVRWLAATGVLGPRVELVGVDLNSTLVRHARVLAEREGLRCRFVTGDAFTPGLAVEDAPRTVVISTGVLHHIAAEELQAFFAAQQRLRVAAFAHWDIDPSRWATVGAWVFHRARMREAVSRHDGLLSARRAYPAAVLERAARAGAPDYAPVCTDAPRWRPSLVDVLRPVSGAAEAVR